MATLQNSVRSTNFTTSLGGTINNADVLLVTEAADEYSAGLDLSATTGITLKAEGEYAGSIGGSGASLQMQGPLARYRARGPRFYLSAAAAITRVEFIPSAGTLGYLTSGAGAVATLVVGASTFTVLDGGDAEAVEVDTGRLVVQEDASNLLTSLLIGPRGTINTERGFASAQIAGRLVIENTAAQFTGAVTVRAGGTLDIRAMAAAGASSAVTVERLGVVDLSNARTVTAFDDITWTAGSILRTSRNGPGYTAGGTETGTPDIVYVD